MTREALQVLLSRHADVKVDGDVLTVSGPSEVSLYVAVGTEPLIVDKVSSFELEAEAVVVSTRRKERYVVAYQDVRAIRVVAGDGGRTGY